MRKVVGVAVGILSLLMTAASAADLPVKAPPPMVVEPAYSWTGIYGGINGGWSEDHMFWAYDPPVPANPRQTNAFDWNQGVGGVHAGAQWQFDHFVLGGEVGYIWNHSSWQAFPCPNAALSCQAMVSDLWTVGPRAGYAWDKFLVYGTGGFAAGHTATQVTFGGIPTGEASQRSQDGWFGGIGAEYAIWTNRAVDVILGAEWTHVDLGTTFHCVTAPTCVVPSVLNRDISAHEDMFRVRLSVKLNPWQPSLVAKY